MPAWVEYTLPVEFKHAAPAPWIVGIGKALIVILIALVYIVPHPSEEVCAWRYHVSAVKEPGWYVLAVADMISLKIILSAELCHIYIYGAWPPVGGTEVSGAGTDW
jgi:hypothetical protein